MQPHLFTDEGVLIFFCREFPKMYAKAKKLSCINPPYSEDTESKLSWEEK